MDLKQELLRHMTGPHGEPLRDLFLHMPVLFLDHFSLHTLEEGQTLVRMWDDCNRVYLLLDGTVQALNLDPDGNAYAFARFDAPELFGEFEVLADFPHYRSTLVALSHCTLLSMEASTYLEWMRQDHHALFLRTRNITRNLVQQTSQERSHLFLSAYDRLCLYFTRYYSQQAANEGFCVVNATRQQIADETGFSVKTVNRCITRLRNEGLVSAAGKRVAMDYHQYRRLALLGGWGPEQHHGE